MDQQAVKEGRRKSILWHNTGRVLLQAAHSKHSNLILTNLVVPQKEKDGEPGSGMNLGHWAGLGFTVTWRPGLELARGNIVDWLVQ